MRNNGSRRPYTLRAVRSIVQISLLALLLGCAVEPRPQLLLLITVDTLRADHIGAYGNPNGLTPAIDELAADSLRFTASYAPAAYTLPSVAALHTGRYPEELGILANRNVFRGSSVTLAEILRLEGWRTGAAVSNWVLRSGTGIENGFDIYDDVFTQREANRDHPERPAGPTTDAALAVLDGLLSQAADSVFLWVHYQDPHGPYVPPGDRRDRQLASAMAAPDAKRELPSFGINAVGAIPNYQLVDGRHDVGFYRAGYAGEVTVVDDELRRLLEGVASRHLLDRATIVFTADHGESLGEDDYWFSHGEFLSDALVRVPLLIRDPRVEPGVRTDIASTVDLLPTLTALAGVDAHVSFPGRDLLAGDDPAGGHAYLATLLGAANKKWGWVEDGHVLVTTALPDGGERATLRSLETGSPVHDLQRLTDMRAALTAFRSELRVQRAVEQKLAPSEREMLRQLGYIE